MPKPAMLLLMSLAGCSLLGTRQQAGPDSVQGWRLASGRMPSRAEYAAIVASCQDGAVPRAQGRPLDACLADLGLKRE
ncbi:MAG TPA: hypothetical protein VNF04_13465 [Stellaceae bacterium]|nr:hypothetical protein [Stellaceae bacterium]